MLEEALVASAMHVGDEVMCISVFSVSATI